MALNKFSIIIIIFRIFVFIRKQETLIFTRGVAEHTTGHIISVTLYVNAGT